jgi:hypothetical protein
VITVVAAVLLAFFLHIDSLQILRQLESDPTIRAKLIQSVDTAMQRAEDSFALSAASAAMASSAIRSACNDVNTPGLCAVAQTIPLDLINRNDGINWIKSTVHDANECNRLLVAYGNCFDEKTRVWLHDLRQSANAIRTDLTELNHSTLVILPNPFPTGKEYFRKYWRERMHLLGTLMTAVFLSLGAPFWYNALKQLSSLRPAIAQKVEHKPASAG